MDQPMIDRIKALSAQNAANAAADKNKKTFEAPAVTNNQPNLPNPLLPKSEADVPKTAINPDRLNTANIPRPPNPPVTTSLQTPADVPFLQAHGELSESEVDEISRVIKTELPQIDDIRTTTIQNAPTKRPMSAEVISERQKIRAKIDKIIRDNDGILSNIPVTSEYWDLTAQYRRMLQ